MGPGLRTLRISIKRLLQRILPKAHVLPNPTKSYQSASHAQGGTGLRLCNLAEHEEVLEDPSAGPHQGPWPLAPQMRMP